MTEEEVKLRSITPALVAAGWDTNHISMETKITDGKINLRGNLVSRGQPKRADYILWLDSDMTFEANTLERMLKVLDKDDGYSLCVQFQWRWVL